MLRKVYERKSYEEMTLNSLDTRWLIAGRINPSDVLQFYIMVYGYGLTSSPRRGTCPTRSTQRRSHGAINERILISTFRGVFRRGGGSPRRASKDGDTRREREFYKISESQI